MEKQIAKAFQLIPYGIYLLITGLPTQERTMIVSWVSQISYSPPLIILALRHNRPVLNLLKEGSFFSLNLLKREHASLVSILKNFSFSDIPGLNFLRMWDEFVYLKEALASWLCQVHSLLKFGDHVLVIGQVKTAYLTAGAPLTTSEYGKTYIGQR